MDKFNVANKVTICRILLVPFILIFLLLETKFFNTLAIFAFVVASLTDFLDGYLARKMNIESALGGLLDLLADKVLVTTVLIWLVYISGDIFVALASILIILRELIITSVRLFFSKIQHSLEVPVSYLGKSKTAVQLIAITILIYSLQNPEIPYLLKIGPITIAVILSLGSLFDYYVKFIKSF